MVDTEVMPLIAQKSSDCHLVARMGVGINKSGITRYVDLFDLAPAVSAEGVPAAFHNLPSFPGHDSDGLVPLCGQHQHQDSMGQLLAKFESQTRLIGGAMCMFRVCAEPEPKIMQDIDGLIAKVQARCCVCNQTMTLQQAGAPERAQKMIRMCVGELALANVILQSDGGQPFEAMQLQAITADDLMHEQRHKFQALAYQKFATGDAKMGITTTPYKEVQNHVSTPRQTKRLKMQRTADIPDSE